MLTWEHCHTRPWKESRNHFPTHVAVLHNVVAVLTTSVFGVDAPDILFLSSTGLHSWTGIDQPYEGMSLTIYQSKLVLVGGIHPSTRELTNKLLTSTTGKQWEHSLPPMPTERYGTSSVSTRSPEVLVVAGGWCSINKSLNVVEVLQGDNWHVVEPLPALVGGVCSTLHNEKLFFMSRGGQENSTVFTCSCTSLISSYSNSRGNSSIEKPLWQQLPAPGGGWFTTIVSFSSRLVFIDGCGTVRGYFSMARSWLMATSIGPKPDGASFIGANVLNTGELIFAHQDGGVYRGAVSGEMIRQRNMCMYVSMLY